MGTETLQILWHDIILRYIDKAPQRWGRKRCGIVNVDFKMLI